MSATCTISHNLFSAYDPLSCSLIIYLAVLECNDLQNDFLVINGLKETTGQ